jgi:protein tyrosine/serine phosphatase
MGCIVWIDPLSPGFGQHRMGGTAMLGHFSMRALLIAATTLGVATAAGVWTYKNVRWKNFAEVSSSHIYRSGQLSERQLESAVDRYGLRRVICLNSDFVDRERALCERKRIEFHHFPMPSDGRGAMEQFTAIYRLLQDQDAKPVLVHCNAGVARTGVAVALYRIIHDGWSTDKALDELRSFERRGRMTIELQQHVRQMAVQVRDAIRR